MTAHNEHLTYFNPIAEARNDYGIYASVINPRYQIPPHVDVTIQFLEAVERGEIDRGMINMPPRHSKSYTVTETFPAWYLGRHPDKKVIIVANVAELASDMGNKIRTKIQSKEHQAIFPDCKLSKDTKAKDNFTTTAGGEFFAVGVGGTLPGRGGHLICIDDPIKGREEADSEVQRKKVHSWYEGVLYNRMEPGAAVLMVTTRWHENDLAGWLLDPTCQEKVDDWQILSHAAIAEKDEGWRKEGEALWPERWPVEALQRIKRNSSQRTWAALYQQRPSAIEGIEIKRAWFKEYFWNPYLITREEISQITSAPFRILQSWDTAWENGPENDFSVCTTWLSTASGEYLLDVLRKKMLTPELFRCAKEQAIRWRPDAILLEKKSSGISLYHQMEAHTKLPIIGVVPQGDKITRMRACSFAIESGRMYVPVQAPWKKDYLDEMCAFPTAAHDDQTDSTSQYLSYIKLKQFEEERFDLYAQEQKDFSMFTDIDI